MEAQYTLKKTNFASARTLGFWNIVRLTKGQGYSFKSHLTICENKQVIGWVPMATTYLRYNSH